MKNQTLTPTLSIFTQSSSSPSRAFVALRSTTRRCLVSLGALASMVLSLNSAEAISFDDLTAIQSSIATSGTVATSTATSPTILGGSRFIRATSNGNINTSGVVGVGNFSHSQDAITTGTTFIRWDGNADTGLQPAGLVPLDLTKDAATAIKITVIASDSAFGQPITVSFTLYDSTDASGLLKRSTGSFTVNSGIVAPTDFTIPFASFTPVGFSGGVDFKKIGAIEMLTNGSVSTSHDLALRFIGTNGNCPHVPVNGLVVDLCDVCNGDNSTCSDCLGVPNGPALPGITCPTGGFGICSDGTWTGVPPKNCACTPDNTPKTEICDSLDNNCDGMVDEGFGKGNSCTVGVGACQVTGVKICGVNGGVTCSRTPGTPSTEICDGIDNDCDGLVDEDAPTSGPLVDQCGVCKGDGKTCLDCKGMVNGTARVDECNVCGGDGTSCLQCSNFDQSQTLGDLDSGAKEQQKIVRGAIVALRSIPSAAREARFISKTLEAAQRLQILNWELSWSLPVIATDCKFTTSVCVSTTNLPILTGYRENNLKLRDLALDVMKKVRRYRRNRVTARDMRILQAAEKQFQANLALSQTVPESQFACTGGATAAGA